MRSLPSGGWFSSSRAALQAHPVVFAAGVAWLALIAFSLSGEFAVFVMVVSMVIGSSLAWLLGSRRFSMITVLALLAVLCSFGIQAGSNQLAVHSMGSKAYFSTSQATFLVLDEPKLNHGHFQASVRLVDLDEKPIQCLAEIPLISELKLRCEPRGIASWAESQVVGKVVMGQRLSAEALFKPTSRARAAYEAKLKDLHLEPASTLDTWLSQLHENYRRYVAGVNTDAAALVMGLAIGDTSRLSEELKQAMQITGLTHLNAVSGANCAVVIGLVWLGLRRTRLNRLARTIAALLVLGAYVLLVGQQPSVLRAAVMLAAVLLAQSSGRRIRPLDALAAAIVLLLLFDPWLAVDYGFVLSVLATLGLVLLTEPITKQLKRARVFKTRLPNWLSVSLGVVLAAQVLCLPVILSLSGYLPTYTVAANLLAEPLVAPVTVLGLLAVCFVWLPPVTFCISWLASLPAALIAIIAKSFSALPMSELPWLNGLGGVTLAVVICISTGWLLLSVRYRRWAWLILSVTSAVGLSIALMKPISSLSWPGVNWTVVACDVGQGDAFVLKSQGKVAVIDVGKDPKPIRGCLQQLKVTRIELLVLTHFDMDHVGGIQGVTGNFAIETIMETPWPDERPTANFIRAAAEQSGAQIVLAETGLSGVLGDLRWQVLTPSKTASEAEDSNDGSIGMLWTSENLNVLTLADLGEKGQMRLVEQNPSLVAQARSKPLVLKVAHHGSADFYPELYEALGAPIALIGVGAGNSYGHPTNKALAALSRAGSHVYRTDKNGAIAVAVKPTGSFEVAVGSGG